MKKASSGVSNGKHRSRRKTNSSSGSVSSNTDEFVDTPSINSSNKPITQSTERGGPVTHQENIMNNEKPQKNKSHNVATIEELNAKNYRLAKELSELRIRHRDETRTVTRLTMENMQLATKCREYLNTIAQMREEMNMQKKVIEMHNQITEEKIQANTSNNTPPPPPPPPPAIVHELNDFKSIQNSSTASTKSDQPQNVGPISSDFFLVNEEDLKQKSPTALGFSEEIAEVSPITPASITAFRIPTQNNSSIEAFDASFESPMPKFQDNTNKPKMNLAFDVQEFSDPFFIGSLDLNETNNQWEAFPDRNSPPPPSSLPKKESISSNGSLFTPISESATVTNNESENHTTFHTPELDQNAFGDFIHKSSPRHERKALGAEAARSKYEQAIPSPLPQSTDGEGKSSEKENNFHDDDINFFSADSKKKKDSPKANKFTSSAMQEESKKLDAMATTATMNNKSKRRNVRHPISYAEPSIGSKLRRGDIFFQKQDVEESQQNVI